jgi:hypothetical protein
MSQNYNSPTTAPTNSLSADQPKIEGNDDALLTNFSGATAPTTTYVGQHWFDTTSKILYVRNANNDGWGTCSNPERNEELSGSFTIDATHNLKLILVSNTSVINLPTSSTLTSDFNFRFFTVDTTSTVVRTIDGSTFHYNDSLISSVTIPSSDFNSIFLVYKNGADDKYVVSGVSNKILSDFSNISDVGKKVLVDLIYPVGSEFLAHSNIAPPLQGVLGVSWQSVNAGATRMSANTGNVGQFQSGNRADTGSVIGHVLTIAEMASHNHDLTSSFPGPSLQVPDMYPSEQLTTEPLNITLSNEGNGASHLHGLSIRNIKLLMYKRIS